MAVCVSIPAVPLVVRWKRGCRRAVFRALTEAPPPVSRYLSDRGARPGASPSRSVENTGAMKLTPIIHATAWWVPRRLPDGPQRPWSPGVVTLSVGCRLTTALDAHFHAAGRCCKANEGRLGWMRDGPNDGERGL